MLTVKIASTQEERNEIYKLRYEIYVKEIGLKQTYACHASETVSEPLDENACLFFAKIKDEVVGVCRLNYARHDDLRFYSDIYDLDRHLEKNREETAIASKLLVKQSHRNTQVTYRILMEMYKNALSENIKYTFMDCAPTKSLVNFYKKWGFIEHKAIANHPDTGVVTVLKLVLGDVEHFKSVKSPFLKFH